MSSNANYVMIDNDATAVQKILNQRDNNGDSQQIKGLAVLCTQTVNDNIEEIEQPLGEISELEALIGKTYFDYHLNQKVDKIEGKGLSTCDYTIAEHQLLAYTEPPQNILIQGTHFEVDANDNTKIIEFKNINDQIITIPFGITAIEDRCPSNATKIILPNSLKNIGANMFYGCNKLTNITIPDSVTSIGNSAFYGCSSLTSITIPNSVATIEYSAFADCDNLTSVIIPDSVTRIEGRAFYVCSSLTSVIIPDSVTTMGSGVFNGCNNLIAIYYGDNESAFKTLMGSNFGELPMTTQIYYNSLDNSDVLTLNKKSIENNLYSQSPRNILQQAIDYYIDNENPNIISEFTQIGKEKEGTVTIPYGIEGIKEGELKTQATKLILPNSFKNFYDFMNITDCPNLKEIVIPTTIYLTK